VSHGGDVAAGRDLARYYDLDLGEDPGDVPLYRALARRANAPVLELGVGSGRIAVPLAMDGSDVTGVDSDAAMLARASERWVRARGRSTAGSVELKQDDLLDAHLGPRFGLVIVALNTLLALTTAERQANAFRAIRRHLQPGGLAAVDVWMPGPEDLRHYDGRVLLEWVREDGESGDRIAKTSSSTYDRATESLEVQSFFDAWSPHGGAVRRVARLDHLRLIGADELVRLAEEAGLKVEQLGRDYELSPFGPGAERAVLVAGLV
jgi:SAM-dependent methyltransferase